MEREKIFLGLDPGIASLGFGVIKEKKGEFKILNYGVIKTSPSLPYLKRLERLEKEVLKLIKKYHPFVISVESVFFFKNLKTATRVSEVKGIILLTTAKKRIPIIEVTPLQIKAIICGYGKANKKQVQKMIKKILKMKDIPKSDDAADALAIALVGAFLLKKPLTTSFEII